MQIAIVKNGTVTRMGDYRELFPNTSFPTSGPSAEFMAEHECMGVTMFKPHNRTIEKLTPVASYIENGAVYTVAVEAKSQSDIDADTANQAAQIRASRKIKLAECDWTQLADSPADDVAWAVYRQALRDVTAQAGFPWTITWPDAP